MSKTRLSYQNIASLTLWFLLAIAFAILMFCTVNRANTVLPYAIEYRVKKESALNFADFENINDSKRELMLAPCSRMSGYLTDGKRNIGDTVNVCYTTSDYAQTVNLAITEGSFFIDTSTAPKNSYIVISDKLAVKYFMTTDCIGSSVFLDSKDYTVCGVYKTDESFLNDISSSLYQTVYVPYNSGTYIDGMTVDSFFYSGKDSMFADWTLDRIAKRLDKSIYVSSQHNYYDVHEVISRTFSVYLLFMACVLAVYFMYSAARIFTGKATGGNTKTAILVVVAIACLAFVVWFVKMLLFIPNDFFPQNNIFDFRHYYNVLVQKLQQKNSSGYSGYYENYAYAAVAVAAMQMLLMFAASLGFMNRLIKIIKQLGSSRE